MFCLYLVSLNKQFWFGHKLWGSIRVNFLLDFDNFCRFFECHATLAEKQQTKQTDYSSLSLFASLDAQDTLLGGIIVE
jgi:hypothetical protein